MIRNESKFELHFTRFLHYPSFSPPKQNAGCATTSNNLQFNYLWYIEYNKQVCIIYSVNKIMNERVIILCTCYINIYSRLVHFTHNSVIS